MKFNKKTAAAVTLAAALACGTLAGCDLITSDTQKDMLQVVAEVDISRGKEFASGGAYEKYAQTIDVSNVKARFDRQLFKFGLPVYPGRQFVQRNVRYH